MQEQFYECDHLISGDMARPGYCEILKERGVTQDVPYQYRIGDDFIIPFTNAFDTEKIYEQMDQNALYTMGLTVVPAYRTSDMERCLDGFSIIKESRNHYVIWIQYNEHHVSGRSNRIPDALAMLLITMLDNKIITVDEINRRIKGLK